MAQEVSSWEGLSVHPHRLGGQEFRLGGLVSTSRFYFEEKFATCFLPMALPKSTGGSRNFRWISFRFRGEPEVEHVISLMQVPYLRYSLNRAMNHKGCLKMRVNGCISVLAFNRWRNLSSAILQDTCLSYSRCSGQGSKNFEPNLI
jgi:hypothetical protein